MEYDAGLHKYTDSGVNIPSVTKLLSPPCAFYSPGSAERGTKIHEACTKWAHGPEGYESSPYVNSFVLWHFKYNPMLLCAEEIIEGNLDGMRYAGRYDMLFIIDGKRVLVDIKTGVKAKWHVAQMAAYSLAVKPAKCLLLYLHSDMTYAESWLSSADLVLGISTFRQALEKYYDVP